MKLRDICKKVGLKTDGLDYAAGSLGIGMESAISGRDLERIRLFLKAHAPYSSAVMNALQALDPDNDDGDFWDRVKNLQQTDESSIKFIYVKPTDFQYTIAGIKYFKVVKESEGKYRLEARENWSSEFCEAVYWLPYVAGIVTSVNRAVYETDASLDFFLTVELSSCRFTVTDQAVYHVAFDAGEGTLSSSRTGAEVRQMDTNQDPSTNRRRLSIGGNDVGSYGYGFFEQEKNRATVIGVRRGLNHTNQEWVYKVFIYHSLAYRADSTTKALVQILDNTKYENNSFWAQEFQ